MKQTDIFKIMDMAKNAREQGRIFNPMFSGEAGIGKSEIVQQWCKLNNYPFIDLRLAYMEPPDLIGVIQPTVVNEKNLSVNYLPDFWPHEENSVGVLLLEEINRAPQSVLNACMQLLTDRKVHKYSLPKGWIIASCINPEDSENDVNLMDTALRDRFAIFNIEYDKKTFVDYMKKTDFNKFITMFIESDLWKYKKASNVSNVDGMMYLSSRSWKKLDTAIRALVPEDMEWEVYEELLGKVIGKDFYRFKNNEKPVTVSDLLKKESESLVVLKKYSDPEDYKSVLINITCKDILDNEKEVSEELLSKVCMVIPSDKAVDLIAGMESKRNDLNLLEKLCKLEPKLVKKFKTSLKK